MFKQHANPHFYSGKKVLVAGGTGTIGIPMVRRLVEMGAAVRVASLDSYQYARQVLPSEVEFSHLDLTVLENCLKASRGMDVVCNLLTIKGSVGIGESQAATYWIPMVLFQTNLMEAAFRNQA